MRSSEVRNPSGERVLGFDEALAVVLHHARAWKPRATEQVALEGSSGRVLAGAIFADRDQPPFDRSTRDGYAVRAEELSGGARLKVAGEIAAGQEWDGVLDEGTALGVMTGAPVPRGADAVVMLEHVERDDGSIWLSQGRRLNRGENIVPRGSEAREGDEVLAAGSELGPAAVALAASCGAAMVEVYAVPTVSILATGDELVDLSERPGPVQIRNSNSYGLSALTAQAGAIPRRLPPARDRREDLRRAIAEARAAELMVLSGGVSMGEYDLVEEVLLEMGAEFFFTGVRMQPGKPVVFGQLPALNEFVAVPFFGLPGNPVSTQVTFACLVAPMIQALCGREVEGPRFAQARLRVGVAGKRGLTRVLPARVTHDREMPTVEPVVWQGSGDMAANARANGYVLLPEEVEEFRAGDAVTVLLK